MVDDAKKGPHRFQPGQSGNPAGRERGTGEVGKLRKQIAEHIPEIIQKLVTAAKAGDAKAARLLLDRVVPPLRAESALLSLPDLATADGLVAQGNVLVKAVAEGRLAPDAAAALLSALNSQSRLIEIEDLQRRLAALEEGTGHDLI